MTHAEDLEEEMTWDDWLENYARGLPLSYKGEPITRMDDTGLSAGGTWYSKGNVDPTGIEVSDPDDET